MENPLPPKVQFIAVRTEIIDLLEKGYSYSQVYKIFIGNGKFTMSYSSFLRFVKGKNQKKSSQKNINANKSETKTNQADSHTFGTKDFKFDENI